MFRTNNTVHPSGAMTFAANASELKAKHKNSSSFFGKNTSRAQTKRSRSAYSSSCSSSSSSSCNSSYEGLSFKVPASKKLRDRCIVGWLNFCDHITIKWYQLMSCFDCCFSKRTNRNFKNKITALKNEIKSRSELLTSQSNLDRAQRDFETGHFWKGVKHGATGGKNYIKSVCRKLVA